MAGNLVHITTFGCQMNEYDSERMAGLLERAGYMLTEEEEAADIILFNTCSVRDSAEQRLFGRVWELKPLKQKNPDLIIGVCGCMGQQYGEEMLKKLPHIDLVMGPRQIPDIAEYVTELQNHDTPLVKVGFDDPYQHEEVVKRNNKIKAYVSIMEGCNHVCTFCIVPFTRGKQVNRPAEDVLKQIRKLAEQGYKEITLLGQNVDAWRNKGMGFGDLLKAVNEIDGIERIRYTSPHPSHITESVIEAIKQSPKVCESFHLPLQSGSNRILQEMKRVYTIEKYMELLNQIKNYWPDAGMTSDIIVGFPSETEEDFEETLQVVREAQFDNAFCFMFSPRTGTPAATMENQLPLEIRKSRVQKLIDMQVEIMAKKMKTHIGKTFEILVEGESNVGREHLFGRTRTNLIAAFPPKNNVRVGDLVNVAVTDASAYTLFSEIV
jgi:tRNA-2-methylthio-N6-dimethylallyladenosine synthase